jgi:hypothetical protein
MTCLERDPAKAGRRDDCKTDRYALIDTDDYRMLTFKLEVSGAKDVGCGSVARVFWGNDLATLSVSEDIVVETGVNTYVLGDLDELAVESGLVGQWNHQLRYLRFDAHEFWDARSFDLHSLVLAPYDTAAPVFDIQWEVDDPDDDASIKLFYDTNRNPADGKTLFKQGLKENSSDGFSWDTFATGLAPGKYYLLAEITDGLNTTSRYATGPLAVKAPSGPLLGLQPAGLDFGGLEAEVESRSLALRLTNTQVGGAPLQISAMVLSDSTHYSLDTGGGVSPCGSRTPSLPPGASCTVEVRFAPTSPGDKNAALQITSNSVASPIQTVPLTGVGVDCGGLPARLDLSSSGVEGPLQERACIEIRALSYRITAVGDVEFCAGYVISLDEGFSVAPGGTFDAIVADPAQTSCP